MPLVFGGVPGPVKKRPVRAAEVLEQVGLGDRMDHEPTEQSGGQMQRGSGRLIEAEGGRVQRKRTSVEVRTIAAIPGISHVLQVVALSVQYSANRTLPRHRLLAPLEGVCRLRSGRLASPVAAAAPAAPVPSTAPSGAGK